EKAKAAIHPVSGSSPSNNHNGLSETPHGQADGGGCLSWPEGIRDSERRAITDMIERHALNGSAQLVIDELAGAMAAKYISNRAAYARRLIEAAAAGTFTPERAHAIREGRERREATERAQQHRVEELSGGGSYAENKARLDQLLHKHRRRHGTGKD